MNNWRTPEDYQNKLGALVKNLRQEASEAKGCFTTFSFQAIALSAAALGIIFNSMRSNTMSALAVVPLISLLMVVARIGIYKYTAANRAYGLQAYVERTEPLYRNESLKQYEKDAFENLFENSDWERLFMVWRIVMPSIISQIYKFPNDGNFLDLISPSMYRHTSGYLKLIRGSRTEDSPEIYEWFKLKKLTKEKYRPGTYLKNMLLVLTIMQFLYLLSLFIDISYDIATSSKASLSKAMHAGLYSLLLEILDSLASNPSAIILLFAFVIMFFLVYSRNIRTIRRREMLESGILSIHSCAVVWRLTLIAHARSLRRASIAFSLEQKSSPVDAYSFDREYLNYLQEEINGIRDNARDPSKWLEYF